MTNGTPLPVTAHRGPVNGNVAQFWKKQRWTASACLTHIIAAVICSLPLMALSKDNPDESFFKNATQAGIAEVEAGKMAETQCTSAAVKEFAAMMVKDHSAANAKLQKIAMSKGVELPTEPSLMQKVKAKKDRDEIGRLVRQRLHSGADRGSRRRIDGTVNSSVVFGT